MRDQNGRTVNILAVIGNNDIMRDINYSFLPIVPWESDVAQGETGRIFRPQKVIPPYSHFIHLTTPYSYNLCYNMRSDITEGVSCSVHFCRIGSIDFGSIGFLIRAFFNGFVSEALMPTVTPLSASTHSGLAVKALNWGEEFSTASCFFVTSMGHLWSQSPRVSLGVRGGWSSKAYKGNCACSLLLAVWQSFERNIYHKSPLIAEHSVNEGP